MDASAVAIRSPLAVLSAAGKTVAASMRAKAPAATHWASVFSSVRPQVRRLDWRFKSS